MRLHWALRRICPACTAGRPLSRLQPPLPTVPQDRVGRPGGARLAEPQSRSSEPSWVSVSPPARTAPSSKRAGPLGLRQDWFAQQLPGGDRGVEDQAAGDDRRQPEQAGVPAQHRDRGLREIAGKDRQQPPPPAQGEERSPACTDPAEQDGQYREAEQWQADAPHALARRQEGKAEQQAVQEACEGNARGGPDIVLDCQVRPARLPDAQRHASEEQPQERGDSAPPAWPAAARSAPPTTSPHRRRRRCAPAAWPAATPATHSGPGPLRRVALQQVAASPNTSPCRQRRR